MKVLVVFDSAYGNTEKIARAIGDAIGGDTWVIHVNEVNPVEVHSYDMVVIGSPTQGGRATQPIQDFINKIDVVGVNVASFDTRLTTKWVGLFGYAAGRIADNLKKKGGNLVLPPEPFYVQGKEGPLKDGELERAAEWGKKLVEGKK